MTEPKRIQTIADLHPDPDNANLGTERGLRVLDDSLRECGAGRSILADRDGTVIAGNKTLERAADIGLPVRVIKTDGTELVVVQRTDLDLAGDDGQRERARRLAYLDNRSSELGLAWDATQVLADLEAGVNLDGLWRDDELTELLAGLVEPEAVADPGAQLSKADELQEKWGTALGQVWKIPSKSMLGQYHWLMCGDSTEMEEVARLLNDKTVDMIFADPPYELSVGGLLSAILPCKRWIVMGGGREMFKYIAAAIADYRHYSVYDGGASTMFKGPHPTLSCAIVGAFGEVKFDEVAAMRIWRRSKSEGSYPSQYLPFFRSFVDEKYLAKPLDFMQYILALYGDTEDILYDPFLGSGTTMLAAEYLGRCCYGMELSPTITAVALERLAGAGLRPVLVV